MSDDRKKNGNSEIDRALSPAERDAFFAFAETGHTLKEAVQWLYEHKLLTLSAQTVSTWLAARREDADDFRFQQLLATIRHDNDMAKTLGAEIGTAAHLNDANVLMLSQALFEARRTRDPKAVKASAKLFAMVLEANAKAKAAEAAVVSAETARERFQFNAAKQALAKAAELQQINQSGALDLFAISRAVTTLFGRRPGTLAPDAAGVTSGEANPPPAKDGFSSNPAESESKLRASGSKSVVTRVKNPRKSGSKFTDETGKESGDV